jgi:hypothetical protein
VSFAKKLSTALSQEADVGVKWNTNRMVFNPFMNLGVLVISIAVDNQEKETPPLVVDRLCAGTGPGSYSPPPPFIPHSSWRKV